MVGRLLSFLRAVTRVRFLLTLVLPNVVFAILASLTDAATLIPVLNLVVLALAIGVCTAYMPPAYGVLMSNAPLDKADLLTLGIVSSWFSLVLRTSWSVSWRFFGMPPSMANTDFTSYFIWMVCCAGICHLAAPGALKEAVPPRRWIIIGSLVAVGVMASLLVLYAANIQAVIQMAIGPHDMNDAPVLWEFGFHPAH